MPFLALWSFFWDLWCLRSPVVCQNHMSEQYFIPNSFHCGYSIPVYCENCPTLYAYYEEQIKLSAYTFIARTTDTWWLDLKLSTVRNHITIQNLKSFRMYENISFFQKKMPVIDTHYTVKKIEQIVQQFWGPQDTWNYLKTYFGRSAQSTKRFGIFEKTPSLGVCSPWIMECRLVLLH